MPGTLVENKTGKELLERYLAVHKLRIANSVEELLGPETGQSQDEIQEEVDDFLRLRKKWRKEDSPRNFD